MTDFQGNHFVSRLIKSSLNFCQFSNGAASNRTENFIIILIAELDLDFLERRHHQQNATTTDVKGETCSPVETSPEYMDLIKIILLGAPAVGKTSIIQVKTTKTCFFTIFFDLLHAHAQFKAIVSRHFVLRGIRHLKY